MKCSIVDIHTHRPTGKALEPSFAGIHPWQAETRRIEEIVPRFGEVDLVGEIGLDYAGRPSSGFSANSSTGPNGSANRSCCTA